MAGPPTLNWADDAAAGDDTQRVEFDYDQNGIKTVVEYRTDEKGRKVKVTRRIKRTLVTAKASQTVAQRHHWIKFGAEKGKKAGPDTSTTSLGSESVRIKLSVGGSKADDKPEQSDEAKKKAELGGKKITSEMDDAAPPEDGSDVIGAPEAMTGGKYVPPSMRAGARGAGESMNGGRGRDDYPTLRVTNISEDTEEEDLWGIFQRFGRVHRIFLGKDQVTGLCKGFAFVSFEDKKEAEAAMKKVHGYESSHSFLVGSD
ncbi:MAG: translation initiation factor eIF3 subunit g [Cyphobasidiales sp. Tagirdzhanova-0007]|nr:MAG: translation initiation factor eIF3 subunit g [Cyphobasidiales sp. Tagirdzhanova-0007]